MAVEASTIVGALHQDWLRGNDAYKKKDFLAAISHYENADPTAKILFNIGMAHMAMLNFEAAIVAFTKSLEIDDFLAITFNQRGVCYFMQGMYDYAVSDFEDCLKLFRLGMHVDYRPLHMRYVMTKGEIYINIAIARYYQNRKDEAFKYLQEAKALPNTKDPVNEYQRAMEAGEEIYPISIDDETFFDAPKMPSLANAGKQAAKDAPMPALLAVSEAPKVRPPVVQRSDTGGGGSAKSSGAGAKPSAITSGASTVGRPPANDRPAPPAPPTPAPPPVTSSAAPAAPPPPPPPAPSATNNVPPPPPPPPVNRPGIGPNTSAGPPPPRKPTVLKAPPRKIPAPTAKVPSLSVPKLTVPNKPSTTNFGSSPPAAPPAAPPVAPPAPAVPTPTSPRTVTPSSTSAGSIVLKVLAMMGDRKKKIVKENYTSVAELRSEVIAAFNAPANSRVEYFDEDFQEFVEMDDNTDLSTLNPMLKVRVT